MPIIQNKLQTEKDIQDYKEWLSHKPLHYLKSLLPLFKLDLERETRKYFNLNLRIELVNKEIEKRQRSI